MAVDFSNLREVRKALGKSQSKLAALLGASTRAVQSYEQGWRPTPNHVQKMAGLLLALNARRQLGRPSPCWKTRRCPRDVRATCPAYQLQAGELCWLLTGNSCRQVKEPSWEPKLAKCRECPVMNRWLAFY
jgi:transcriptional regulator with XRE-family HTH domain